MDELCESLDDFLNILLFISSFVKVLTSWIIPYPNNLLEIKIRSQGWVLKNLFIVGSLIWNYELKFTESISNIFHECDAPVCMSRPCQVSDPKNRELNVKKSVRLHYRRSTPTTPLIDSFRNGVSSPTHLQLKNRRKWYIMP